MYTVRLATSSALTKAGSQSRKKKGDTNMSPVKANEETLKIEQEKANAENAKRSGVGTRVFAGQTRGKGSVVISWEKFDRSKPETLPTSAEQFMQIVTPTPTAAQVLDYIIDGYNDAQYSAASDEIGEYINDAWEPETQALFRTVVRNFSKMDGQTLESAVAMIKPATETAFQARLAAKLAKAEATV
jgi:hypothetical protein